MNTENQIIKNEIENITSNKIPFGQMLLNNGYNTISMSELRKRFACDAWTKREGKNNTNKVCNVMFEPLESYMKEKIPERCLLSVCKARAIGINSFSVAYPVIEEKKLKDPIIIGKFRDSEGSEIWIEIDMWE